MPHRISFLIFSLSVMAATYPVASVAASKGNPAGLTDIYECAQGSSDLKTMGKIRGMKLKVSRNGHVTGKAEVCDSLLEENTECNSYTPMALTGKISGRGKGKVFAGNISIKIASTPKVTFNGTALLTPFKLSSKSILAKVISAKLRIAGKEVPGLFTPQSLNCLNKKYYDLISGAD